MWYGWYWSRASLGCEPVVQTIVRLLKIIWKTWIVIRRIIPIETLWACRFIILSYFICKCFNKNNIDINRLINIFVRMSKTFKNRWLPISFLKIDPGSVVSVLPMHDENNLHPKSFVAKTKLQAPFVLHNFLHLFSAMFGSSNIRCLALHIHNWLAAITLYPSPAKILTNILCSYESRFD